MRSPRRRLELACRIGAFAILGWLLGTSIFPAPRRSVERATTPEVARHLAAWTRLPASVGLHANLESAPTPLVTSWLAALEHSGHAVSWSGSPPATALATEPLVDPRGGLRVAASAPAGTRVILSDAAGLIDSGSVASLGAAFTVPLAIDSIVVRAGRQTMAALAPAPVVPRPVLVIGGASWEGKFVASALEERGWKVIPQFIVAPAVDVHAATRLQIDTAHLSAIVAIDSSVQSLGPEVRRFVEQGGGLVLAGSSASAPGVASLAPGSVGTRLRNNVASNDTIGLGSTGFYPVAAVREDAVALERRGSSVAIAARRVGSGRVLQVGFDDSWRWRMAGGPNSESAHRAWWSRVVSSVAFAPDVRGDTRDSDAPLASFVDQLGPGRPAPATAGQFSPDPRLLFAVMTLLLLVEWISRRLRGLR